MLEVVKINWSYEKMFCDGEGLLIPSGIVGEDISFDLKGGKMMSWQKIVFVDVAKCGPEST